jgi:alanyl-tRNA synthetase
MARIVQDVPSVYDTDGYQAIMGWIAEASGVAYGDSVDATKAHRVLADHGRGMTFLVGEGITPSNEGRGYVLRRIVRRAIQHGLRIGMEAPFVAELSGAVIDQMADAYPELAEHRAQIGRVLRAEEERFSETLERGMRLFEEAAERGAISGVDAFALQATYGFPIELTLELARERGIDVDEDAYGQEMDRHREISRAGAGKGEAQRAADFARAAGFRSEFVGWEKTEVLTQIGALEELGDGLFLAKLRESPFYPEGGGQVTDAGELEKDGSRATLLAAYRIGDDQALLFEGEGFAAGDRVKAVVPWNVRFPTMANHTATHLLHEALRGVLGDHVHQAGSAVRPDKLRFDFSHPQALTAEEREAVERRVNEAVFANHPVRTFVVPIDEARNLGAMMLFGEKYGDEVRVVEVEGVSRELCGGTHVRTTAEIGPFVILGEASVGSGARRIEAVTAGEAFALLRARADEAEELRGELERARKEAKKPARPAAEADYEITAREGDVVVVEARGVTGGDLRDLTDRIRQQEGAAAVLAGSTDDGRAFLVFNLDQSLADRGIDAVALVRDAARHIQGGGGGRPTLAEAGGKKPEALGDALGAAKDALLTQL